jgi:hypothetical protein
MGQLNDTVIPMQKDNHFMNMTIDHDARISILEERFESHSERWDRSFEKILSELKELNKLYNDERLHSRQKMSEISDEFFKKINKIYAAIILGGIGVIWQFVWQILLSKNII